MPRNRQPTYSMREFGAQHIPSELLEPLYASLMSGWGMQVIGGVMSPNTFHERMTALGSLASEAGATHCVLANSNMISRFGRFLRARGRSLDCTEKAKIDVAEGTRVD